jgi:hypothetical protein
MTRRQLLAGGLAYTQRGFASARIESSGMFLEECSIDGETRKDGVFPAHPNGIRLGKNRFLLIYATRGFRGVDEDRSIIYQVRAGSFAGRVLKEGILARSIDDWRPLDDGHLYKKNNGSPTVFGVPKGARIHGKVPPHANLFVAKWYQHARAFAESGRLIKATESLDLMEKTLHVEATQFRLNNAGDDIEILQPPAALRQQGYETGETMCSASARGDMNQSFVNPVPFNTDLTEWIDSHHFGFSDPKHPGGNRIAAIKFRYSPKRHRYDWIETGPVLFYPEYAAIEASTIRLKDSWAIGARAQQKGLPVLWVRSEDPFSSKPKYIGAEVSEQHPPSSGPMTAYVCADGVIRLLTGDGRESPYRIARNPLYCWEVNPDRGFALSNRRVVIDLLQAGLPIRREAGPVADMAKILPHSGGRDQLILHRVRTTAIGVPNPDRKLATDSEKRVHGIYSAHLLFEEDQADAWDFE